jgi:hypothetical protein
VYSKALLKAGLSAEVDIKAIVEMDSIGQLHVECGVRMRPKAVIRRSTGHPAWTSPWSWFIVPQPMHLIFKAAYELHY